MIIHLQEDNRRVSGIIPSTLNADYLCEGEAHWYIEEVPAGFKDNFFEYIFENGQLIYEPYVPPEATKELTELEKLRQEITELKALIYNED